MGTIRRRFPCNAASRQVHVGAVVLMLIIVPIRFSNRHAMFWIPNLYHAKES